MLDQVEQRHRGACLRHGVTVGVFPRQVMESTAVLFSLGQPVAGLLVKSMRSTPTNMVGQTCERVGDCGFYVKRVMTKRRKTVTLNVEKGEVHPRRKDKLQNDTWVAFGVRSVVASRHLKTSSHDMCGEQCCSHPSRPADRGGLAGYMERSMRLMTPIAEKFRRGQGSGRILREWPS